ncbi:MAG: 2-amino-4-hydroxy-6-hydroxymethyldihydropteridine diphosphokinase [Gammaproteobacteria bacterium HGW-Gammaproteobacteria-3]|nr:MAG: 2-amino-4-hydroxy-6-hydroxymethyldihydropteridine diphosphokinase [Gammaproteobacteria bacterium HGW-Gammaproteobacteria-3]
MTHFNDKQPVTVYIGLGSNLEHPARQILLARSAIAALVGVDELAFSSLYSSPPMGPQDQPDYVNAVMAVTTRLEPAELLRCLQRIEREQGRVRKEQRWGARTLDLDLLLYADRQLEEPDLIVPHPGLVERAFVLYPLSEIAPDLQVPGRGALADWLARCPADGLRRLA